MQRGHPLVPHESRWSQVHRAGGEQVSAEAGELRWGQQRTGDGLLDVDDGVASEGKTQQAVLQGFERIGRPALVEQSNEVVTAVDDADASRGRQRQGAAQQCHQQAAAEKRPGPPPCRSLVPLQRHYL